QKLPLASDLTASLAVQVDYDFDRGEGFKGMTHPDKYVSHTGLYQLEPYRPDQIPVIFVHGLMSEPAVWIEALNQLRADPVLVRKYQLLVYRYPTGYPIVYNMASLRKQLAAFKEHYDPGDRNPNMSQMMLVGHSMGSVLSNSMIRSSGDAFTGFLFDRPIDELAGVDDAQKVTLKELLIFDSNPNVTRAVLLAGPFRGAKLATGGIGALGRSLIKFPATLVGSSLVREDSGIDGLTEEGHALLANRPDSIGSLKPDAPVLTCILENPVRDGVTVHTIIGHHDPEDPLEESTDGTVAYTSAHLDEAVSEKVVHAKHTPLCKHPETLEELRRILYLHAGLGSP
ncbi:MAG: esterase/lipase family protein, partial [Verrucomicrobiales bacterium]